MTQNQDLNNTPLKYIARIITSPAVLFIYLIFHILMVIQGTLYWVLNGGEIMSYSKRVKPSIVTIFLELEKQNKFSEKLINLSKKNETES